jgi:hypothetical protein
MGSVGVLCHARDTPLAKKRHWHNLQGAVASKEKCYTCPKNLSNSPKMVLWIKA